MGKVARSRIGSKPKAKPKAKQKAKAKPNPSRIRSRRNILWIEKFCRVPEGRDVGKPLVLRPFQRKIIRTIYDNPAGTRTAIVSMGRKNAKTVLSACLLLLHLVGPEARLNSQLVSAAQSRDQAALLWSRAAQMVAMNSELEANVVVRDTRKELECTELGTLYRAISAESTTAQGLSPVFIVHDELGQVQGPRSALYEALETSIGAQSEPLSIVISTQAPTDQDLLSTLIDDALENYDAQTVVVLYTAELDEDTDPFSVPAIRQANPAYGDFLISEHVRRMAKTAKRMPAREAFYRNYVLNQRVERSASFIARSVWLACGDAPKPLVDVPVYGGLDLGEASNDLTALVWIGNFEGVWHVHPTFWLPEEGLREKSAADRVPYDVWRDQGFLRTTPGKTIDYTFLAAHLFSACQDMDVQRIAFDPWNFSQFRRSLVSSGFTEEQTEGDEDALFFMFRQGWKSISPALRTIETDLMNTKIAHGSNPILTMCANNSVVKSDAPGNRMLVKRHPSQRIDGMIALTMARAIAEHHEGIKPGPTIYDIEKRGLLLW